MAASHRRNERQPQQHRRRHKLERRGFGHCIDPDCPGQPSPEPTHRAASFSAGRNRRLGGAAQLNRQAERRQRQAGDLGRTRCFDSRDQGRSTGQPNDRLNEEHQRFFEKDRRHHLGDRRHHIPDRHTCAERRGRSSACRRTGPRLRGAGCPSAQSGWSLGLRGQADRKPDQRERRACRAGHGSGQPSRCDDDTDRQLDPASDRHMAKSAPPAASRKPASLGLVRRSAGWTRRRSRTRPSCWSECSTAHSSIATGFGLWFATANLFRCSRCGSAGRSLEFVLHRLSVQDGATGRVQAYARSQIGHRARSNVQFTGRAREPNHQAAIDRLEC